MKADWKQFIQETRDRFACPNPGWRKDLRNDISVDTAILAAQALEEIVRGVHAGSIETSAIAPEVVEAFHLQFPSAGDFQDFLRQHPDEDQLRGIAAGIKGKLFEMEHADYLNNGHLPVGFLARLATRANQPGYDLIIEDSHHHIAGLIQDKATDSIQVVSEALDRYPKIPVAVPHELAERVGQMDNVFDSGVSGASVDAKVSQIDTLAHAEPGYHFPFLTGMLTIAHEGWRYIRGYSSAMECCARVSHRLSRSAIANAAGQAAALATGFPAAAVASIPTRIAISRMDVNASLARIEGERNRRFQITKRHAEGGGSRAELPVLTSP